DLSTGINPFPYPILDFDRAALTRLPDPAALAGLLTAARAYYRIPGEAGLVAAWGTQQLIQVLPRLIPGERVNIAGPTYSEHEVSWRRAGRTIVTDGVAEGAAEIAVLVNPNNPDGRIAPSLPDAGTVIVDEAFGDVAPQSSSVSQTPGGRVLV